MNRTSIGDLVYSSYLRAAPHIDGLDSATRNISFTDHLLKQLGDPYSRWPRITVAGSKGKGSTAVLSAKLLSSANQRVGLITSPHLRNFNERIRLDGSCVSDEQLDQAAAVVAPLVQGIEQALTPPNYLGPGGIILALAAQIFAASNVTSVVVEAGRGGEYDEARCIKANVSVLTPIMLEHSDKLGATIREIALTKARITAPGAPIVAARQEPEALAAITEVSQELGACMIRSERATKLTVKSGGWESICDIEYWGQLYRNVRLNLPGHHQVENLTTAFTAVNELASIAGWNPIGVSSEALATVNWPGRAQVLQERPLVIADGAINAASTRYVCELARQQKPRRIVCVIAVPAPKDLAGVCKEVARVSESAILTEVETPTLHWYDDPSSIANEFIQRVEFVRDHNKAIDRAIGDAHPDDCVLLIGTQSFVGVVLDRWDVDTCRLW
jgi:dihydrofolate synthase/folylpolyglutamate synthase